MWLFRWTNTTEANTAYGAYWDFVDRMVSTESTRHPRTGVKGGGAFTWVQVRREGSVTISSFIHIIIHINFLNITTLGIALSDPNGST